MKCAIRVHFFQNFDILFWHWHWTRRDVQEISDCVSVKFRSHENNTFSWLEIDSFGCFNMTLFYIWLDTRRHSFDKHMACVTHAAQSASSITLSLSMAMNTLTSFIVSAALSHPTCGIRLHTSFVLLFCKLRKVAANKLNNNVRRSEAYSGSRVGAISRQCPNKNKNVRRKIGHDHCEWRKTTGWSCIQWSAQNL